MCVCVFAIAAGSPFSHLYSCQEGVDC
jgi:hypothetical protein